MAQHHRGQARKANQFCGRWCENAAGTRRGTRGAGREARDSTRTQQCSYPRSPLVLQFPRQSAAPETTTKEKERSQDRSFAFLKRYPCPSVLFPRSSVALGVSASLRGPSFRITPQPSAASGGVSLGKSRRPQDAHGFGAGQGLAIEERISEGLEGRTLRLE